LNRHSWRNAVEGLGCAGPTRSSGRSTRRPVSCLRASLNRVKTSQVFDHFAAAGAQLTRTSPVILCSAGAVAEGVVATAVVVGGGKIGVDAQGPRNVAEGKLALSQIQVGGRQVVDHRGIGRIGIDRLRVQGDGPLQSAAKRLGTILRLQSPSRYQRTRRR